MTLLDIEKLQLCYRPSALMQSKVSFVSKFVSTLALRNYYKLNKKQIVETSDFRICRLPGKSDLFLENVKNNHASLCKFT
ncbi:hypothetical protein T11_5298 [Trichinella zimbabwensis]|uniref:Uncharacterized protein n=1 Tax=Trichinella zimbabwensis TaxID=268475 RepID=A0A0V1GV56_9BILA|nr:hypothetical protein T11_5298 [Trichinella zimbabwensis]